MAETIDGDQGLERKAREFENALRLANFALADVVFHLGRAKVIGAEIPNEQRNGFSGADRLRPHELRLAHLTRALIAQIQSLRLEWRRKEDDLVKEDWLEWFVEMFDAAADTHAAARGEREEFDATLKMLKESFDAMAINGANPRSMEMAHALTATLREYTPAKVMDFAKTQREIKQKSVLLHQSGRLRKLETTGKTRELDGAILRSYDHLRGKGFSMDEAQKELGEICNKTERGIGSIVTRARKAIERLEQAKPREFPTLKDREDQRLKAAYQEVAQRLTRTNGDPLQAVKDVFIEMFPNLKRR